MAVALSIVGSAIAVYQVADRVGQLLSKAKYLYHAPSELFALNNEISDLTVTLQNVEQCLSSNTTERVTLPENKIQHVCDLIDAAKKELLRLEQLVHYRFLRSGTLDGDFKVFRLRWARSRPIVENHRQNLQRIRQNVLMEMQVIGILHQTKTSLVVDEISLISTQTQANQYHTNRQVERVLQELTAHSTILNTIIDDHASLKGILQGASSKTQQATACTPGSHAHVGIDVRAYMSAGLERRCDVYCRCRCHMVYSLKSTPLLKRLLGSLFIGYSGNPFCPTSRCNITSCQSQVIFAAHVHYYFPAWFLRKVLDVEIISTISQEPKMSLTIRGVQPNSAKVNLLIRNNDVAGIQKLFSCGLARPNDVIQYTQTSLLQIAINFGKIDAINVLLNAGAHADQMISSSEPSASWLAWTHILQATFDETILGALRGLFPKSDGMIGERRLSRLHRIVLGFLDRPLGDELATGGLDLDTVDLDGMTALAWATRRNDLTAIDLLLKAKSNSNIPNNCGCSPLYHAAANWNSIAVQLLLDAGVDVGHVDQHKRNALHAVFFKGNYRKGIATSQAKIDTVKMLVKAGASVNARTVEGATPLIYATINNQVTLAEALLDCGAQINIPDFDGDTALVNALHYDAYLTTKLLLQRGVDYMLLNNTGNTILHHAAHPRDLKVLEVLLAANLTGINPNAVNDDGKTALQLAYEHEPKPEGFIEAFQALVFGIANRNDYAKMCQESVMGETEQDALGDGAVVPGAWPS